MGHDHGIGVATVCLEAGRHRSRAPLLRARTALATLAAAPAAVYDDRVAEPQRTLGRWADGVDPSRDLVAQRDRQLDTRLHAVDDVEVGMAHPAAGDPDADLGAGRIRHRHLFDAQRPTYRVEPHGAHRTAG